MKTLLILLSVLSISACGGGSKSPPAVKMETTANGYNVTTLFEYDGCKMVRFEDEGYYRYFAKCAKSKTTSEEHTENCGKGCTRRVVTEVVQEDDK